MKRWTVLFLAALLCFSMTGCDLWLNSSYYSVTPHTGDSNTNLPESLEVSSYSQLQNVLVELVWAGKQNAVIAVRDMEQEKLGGVVDMAIRYVTQSDAIGSYAVENVEYEIGTSTGRTAIAVDISYRHSRSDILRIKKTETMEDAVNVITAALENCDAGVVVLVDVYKHTDYTQMIQDYVDLNPDVCMEMPQVSADVYPQTGIQRVIELSFTYQNSREDLRQMQSYVGPVFTASDLNVRGEEEQSTKFSRMYSFLMERADYTIETSITPAYSLLRHGVGDSKSFATVYAAMCRRAGLDCQTVTGTRAGDPWVWNIICEDGVYYHVDLLQSSSEGRLCKLSPEQMQGYVWDYSAYPASGTAAEAVDPAED